jgi:Rrf2 family protein
MKSTREVDYAVMTLTFLARDGSGRPVVRREIASRLGLPEEFLAKILRKLARDGLVRSFPGAHGGYRLGRSAAQINLADIVRAIEGPVRFLCALEVRAEDCERFCLCEATDEVRRVQAKVTAALEGTTLRALGGRRARPAVAGTSRHVPAAKKVGLPAQ